MERDLKYYLKAFTSLRRDYKYGGAPHKPILILSVIECFEQHLITSNEIYITPELVGEFRSLWNFYVDSPNHSPRFTLPFYHLRNEKSNFWKLVPNEGCSVWIESKSAMRGFDNLKVAVNRAEIDAELTLLLKSNVERQILKQAIISEYFPHISDSNDKYKLIDEISDEIVMMPSVEYKKRIIYLKETLSTDGFAEEVFIRSGRFKREVMLAYKNRCAVSGAQILTDLSISMLDACHIIPFSESYNDTISNGIALTPTLHRAFDRGLIGIDEDYKITVSNSFQEDSFSPYNIKQFAGKQIHLPDSISHFPDVQNLLAHSKRFSL